MSLISQLGPTTPSLPKGQDDAQAKSSSDQEKPKPFLEEIQDQRIKTAMHIGGLGLTALVTGAAFKDGIKTGFNRIAGISESVSSVFGTLATLFTPFTFLFSEFSFLKGKTKGDETKLIETIYPILSLSFTPKTFSEPFKKATESPLHMLTTLINLPHLLYTLFTYTGGRFMSLVKALQINFSKGNKEKQYRLEQERAAFHAFGSIGSAQASVLPMAFQFASGWQVISSIFKGDLGSVWEKFKHEPIATLLGTFCNSWMWPFEWLGKIFDTTIRTAEMSGTLENIFEKKKGNPTENNKVEASGGKESKIEETKHPVVKFFETIKKGWHQKSKEDTFLGGILKHGRGFAKIAALLFPPVGMASIILPMFDKYIRGKPFNKEAQELGGNIGLIDKACNIGSLMLHLYYSTLYGLSVRLPQTITTGTFYITNLINKMRGIDINKPGYEKEEGYIDPIRIRDKIFNPNKGLVKEISDFGASILDHLEKKLHPNDAQLIKDKKPSRFIDNFYKVMAKQEAFGPAREELLKRVIENQDVNGKEVGYSEQIQQQNGTITNEPKQKGEKPSDALWAQVLEENKDWVIKKAEVKFKEYLDKSQHFEKWQIDDFFDKYKEYGPIKAEVEELIKQEIEVCKEPTIKDKKEERIKAKSFLEMIAHPVKYWNDLKEVFKLRTFLARFVTLPLWILGFIKAVDFGKEGEPYWLRNFKAQESTIRVLDIDVACNSELMPVLIHALESAPKGLATLWNLSHGKLPSYEREAA